MQEILEVVTCFLRMIGDKLLRNQEGRTVLLFSKECVRMKMLFIL